MRTPTDNALAERFLGTVKQEKVDLMGGPLDERSAWEETGAYVYAYNHKRPHHNLWNFTPATEKTASGVTMTGG